MLFQRIYLEESKEIYIDAYVADAIPNLTRKAILVIPGGGYSDVCSQREGEPIAMAFMPYGYNAFVLHYSHANNDGRVFPTQLIQASKAVAFIKDHAQEYLIDPEHVFVVGFSAGGHLAGSLGTMWHKQEIYDEIEMPYGYNRPRGVMLIYPVVTGVEKFRHFLSYQNLLGDCDPSTEKLVMCSLEKNVDDRSCPLFVLHTSDDQLVDVRNSLILATAYAEAGLRFELHVYPKGCHGVALGNRVTRCNVDDWDNPSIAKWVESAAMWAESLYEIK